MDLPWPDDVLTRPPFQPRRRNVDKVYEMCSEVFAEVLAEQRRRGRHDRRWLARVGPSMGPEVWEALSSRGVVPASWVANVRRWFRDYDWREWQAPPMMGDAAALASDPAGVEACEALADDLVRRLVPYGVAALERYVWCGSEQHRDHVGGLKEAAQTLSDALVVAAPKGYREAYSTVATRVPPWSEPYASWREGYVRLLQGDLMHAAARATGLSVAMATESPFAPAIAMHQLGYAFGGVSDGAALLVFAKL